MNGTIGVDDVEEVAVVLEPEFQVVEYSDVVDSEVDGTLVGVGALDVVVLMEQAVEVSVEQAV